MAGPRSLEEIMADPTSRLSELAALLMVAGRLSRAREAVKALPAVVSAERRAKLEDLVSQAMLQVEAAIDEHSKREWQGWTQ
jgi:hypothetical protein